MGLAIVFFILCGIAFWAAVVGLFKPSLVIRWGQNRSRKRVLGVYGPLWLVLLIVWIVTIPKTATSPAVAASPPPQNNSTNSTSTSQGQTSSNATGVTKNTTNSTPNATTKSTAPANTTTSSTPPSKTSTMVYSLGMTPSQFENNFNEASSQDGANLNITSLSVDNSGVQGVFQYMFTNNLGITGSVNKKDGSLRDVMLIGEGDGTLQSGADIILGMGLLIQATDPNLTPDQRGQILSQLGLTSQNVNLSDANSSTILNGIKYSFTSSSTTGIMFGIGNANDN